MAGAIKLIWHDAKVLDSRRAEIAHYEIKAQGTGYIALYWGYSPAASVQASHAKALGAAMTVLKHRLEADAQRLNARLRA